MSRYLTIGMAGHIDHGKTALTKALTGVDTDRLKEEKERSISIEPGFAPFIDNDQLQVSIIDVPGHEKFIRQMISGVAGINMVVLVVAADEGIMPQTKEHLDILSLLGIQNGLIVLTKKDQADGDLMDIVLEDVEETVKKTFLEDAPIFLVDSISKQGIPELRTTLETSLLQITQQDNTKSFRLPIDQVFTVKGQGVVVRGTIYDGEVKQGDHLKILPQNKDVRVRQIQRHHQSQTIASAGQRAAINIGGSSHQEVSRGDVLVSDDFFSVTNRLDVVFSPLKEIKYPIKQRQPIKLFIGTSEVMGKIIFFDRNEINTDEQEEILCQIQLDEEIVVARDDRFILRKPTPTETIGGGWIIEPKATKHRFGKQTIEALKRKKEGTPKDRVISLMGQQKVLTQSELLKQASISEQELDDIKQDLLEIEENLYTLRSTSEQVADKVMSILETFHDRYPMRKGMDKAQIVSELKGHYQVRLIEFVLNRLTEDNKLKVKDQYIALTHKTPALPTEWKVRLENASKALVQQGLEVEKWNELLEPYQIPSDIQREFYYYLIETGQAYSLDDERLIAKDAVEQAIIRLQKNIETKEFNLQAARDVLQLTRKNLVPLLELLDRLGYTRRVGNNREWMER